MKPLEKLGISPWPWDFQPNHPDGCRVATAYNCNVSTAEPTNARLIAAAPELYDALYRIVEAADDSAADFDKWLENLHVALRDARMALVEASGEESR